MPEVVSVPNGRASMKVLFDLCKVCRFFSPLAKRGGGVLLGKGGQRCWMQLLWLSPWEMKSSYLTYILNSNLSLIITRWYKTFNLKKNQRQKSTNHTNRVDTHCLLMNPCLLSKTRVQKYRQTTNQQ